MTGKQFRLVLAVTVVSGFLGGAVSNLLLRGAPAIAQADGAVQEVVRAKRFDLVDDGGKRRGVLGILPDRENTPRLALFDAAGTMQVALSGIAASGAVEVYDAAGQRRTWLAVLPDGTPHLGLSDAAGKPRATLQLSPDGRPALTLYDASAKPRATLDIRPDGSPVLALRDAAERTRVILIVSPDIGPLVGLSDAAGKVIWRAP